MVQIAKTILPDSSKLYIALRRVFGIGTAQALRCAEEIGVSKEMRVSDLKVTRPRITCLAAAASLACPMALACHAA